MEDENEEELEKVRKKLSKLQDTMCSISLWHADLPARNGHFRQGLR